MRTAYIILFFALIFLLGQPLQAQTSGNKAKELYVQADNAFRLKDYSKSLDLLNQVQSALGSNNAMIESLRVKNYYEQGDFQKAKSSLAVFFTFSNTAENLLTEMNGYQEKTDAKIKEEQERKLAEQQKALQDEQVRIEKIVQEKKDYQAALDANSVWQYNRFISTYPNSQYLSEIKDKLDDAYLVQGDKYISSNKYEEAKDLFIEYTKKLPNGKYRSNINKKLELTYYMLGEQARTQKMTYDAKGYYNKGMEVKAYSDFYYKAQSRLKEYKNAELQVQKDNLMAEAMKNKSYADAYYSNQKLFLYSGIGFTLPGLGLLGWGISQEFKGGALVGGILGPAMLIGGTVLLSKAPKQKKKGDKYYQEYLNYKKQADGIKLSFTPIVAPNQTYGLALRIEF
jgi:hypothetical protein